MKLSKRSWLLVLALVIVGATTSLAQSRIQVVQGRRAVKDKVTFVVELVHVKGEDPRVAAALNEVQIFTRFADHPATGMVYLDGNAIGRFDESMSFNSNMAEITYGRHTLTLAFSSPTLVTDFYVTIRGWGVVHEILDGQESVTSAPTGLEQRVVDLERKVHELEAELATIKKKRAH